MLMVVDTMAAEEVGVSMAEAVEEDAKEEVYKVEEDTAEGIV